MRILRIFLLAIFAGLTQPTPVDAATEQWSPLTNSSGGHLYATDLPPFASPEAACQSHFSFHPNSYGFQIKPAYNGDGTLRRVFCNLTLNMLGGIQHNGGTVRSCGSGPSNYPCNPDDETELGEPVSTPEEKAALPPGLPCINKNAQVGNPIDVRTGNKYETVLDFSTGGLEPLVFRRFYNSRDSKFGMMSPKWRNSFDRRLIIGTSGTDIRIHRADGRAFHFILSAGNWVPASGEEDARLSLAASGTDWVLTTDDQIVETYNATGQLVSVVKPNGYAQNWAYNTNGDLATVTDSYGRQITFAFDFGHKLTQVTAPDGEVYGFSYTFGLLTGVVYPDGTNITYHYEDTDYAAALTGITDGNGVRFASWAYDSEGRAVSSTHAGGVEATNLTYNADGTVTVTNALGKDARYHIVNNPKGARIAQIEGVASASCAAADSLYTYDTNGYVNRITDREGNVTSIVNDSRGLPVSVTEDDGGVDERLTTYTWHGTFRKPTTVELAGHLRTEFTYDATTGDMLTRTETDLTTHTIPYSTNGQTRQWSYTYTYNTTSPEKLEKIDVDGPLLGAGDTTRYAFDANGYLTSVTDPLGHVTDIVTVNGRGQPTRILDPNGVRTDLAYDARGRLTQRTVDVDGTPAVTQFQYDGVGQLTKIILPDASEILYAYADAHDLIEVANKSGEKIVYTLNALGNVIREDIRDAGGTLKKTLTRTFDELGRMMAHIGAGLQETAFAYNRNDLLTTATDPEANATANSYDGLNRLIRITDALTNDADIALDAADNTTGVTDQRILQTTYVHNGFGEPIRRTSPDTGIADYAYDAAGNVTRITDARGVVTDFTYDNASRRTTRTFPASPAENVNYSYDSVAGGNHGNGRLTRIDDASGSTDIVYDARGNVTGETRTIGGVVYTTEYGYDLADNLIQMIYPSGRLVNYGRDTDGRVVTVATRKTPTDPEQVLATNIAWLPMGPLAGLEFGNGQITTLSYDQDYRVTAIDTTDGLTAVQALAYTYTGAGNIAAIADTLDPGRSQIFAYDALHRLTGATGLYGDIVYAYDAVGNRTSRVVTDGGITWTETLTYAGTSNRLLTILYGSTTRTWTVTRTLTYSNNGNITNDSRYGGIDYVYNDANRLVQVKEKEDVLATTTYNDLGQRVAKSFTRYHYDLDGFLIAESDGLGANLREYVTLAGRPIAVIDTGGAAGDALYVHADHLGSPQKMTDAAAAVVWDAAFTPFGEKASITGTATSNLRFPGQYADYASLLNYNWHRYYDPTTGRYFTSDPIGLEGGLNTYAYAGGNPVMNTDPDGKSPVLGGTVSELLCSAVGICAPSPPPTALPVCRVGSGFGGGESEEERCKKVKNQCIAKCSETALPTPDGLGHAFRRCVRECMEAQGCFF